MEPVAAAGQRAPPKAQQPDGRTPSAFPGEVASFIDRPLLLTGEEGQAVSLDTVAKPEGPSPLTPSFS